MILPQTQAEVIQSQKAVPGLKELSKQIVRGNFCCCAEENWANSTYSPTQASRDCCVCSGRTESCSTGRHVQKVAITRNWGDIKKKENQTWHVTFQMQVPQCITMAPPKTRDDSTVKEAFNNEEGDRHDVIQRMRESRGDHFSTSLSKAALLQMCLSL